MASITGPRLVVSVDDINEGGRDVAFEGKVLSWYGNWDSGKSEKYAYLHCDLIDRGGYTTITISLNSSQIEMHETKMHVGSFVWIENFSVSQKSKNSFEKGDMLVVLKIQSTTTVVIIQGDQTEFVPKFYHSDSIADFWKRSHEAWASATIAACVIGIRGTYACFHQLVIADGCTETDHDIIGLGPQFQIEYNHIVEAFNHGQCVMVLFKNVATTQQGDRYLRTESSMNISTVVDDFVRMQLQVVHNMCKTTPSTREVYGTMSISSPAVTPYRHVCNKCNLSNLIVVEEGYYCNVCHSTQPVTKQAYLRGKIATVTQVVAIFLKGQWLQTLVQMSEEQFLNLSRGQQIKMFTAFRIKGTFYLTPMSFLNRFEEDMDTNVITMPIDKVDSNVDKVDSNAMHSSCTQDSVPESETVVATLPSQRYKRKLDDGSIEASLGTTSTSKLRRT